MEFCTAKVAVSVGNGFRSLYFKFNLFLTSNPLLFGTFQLETSPAFCWQSWMQVSAILGFAICVYFELNQFFLFGSLVSISLTHVHCLPQWWKSPVIHDKQLFGLLFGSSPRDDLPREITDFVEATKLEWRVSKTINFFFRFSFLSLIWRQSLSALSSVWPTVFAKLWGSLFTSSSNFTGTSVPRGWT